MSEMRTPRTQAEKLNDTKPSGEPKNYCGTCGLPSNLCDCASMKVDTNVGFTGKPLTGGEQK